MNPLLLIFFVLPLDTEAEADLCDGAQEFMMSSYGNTPVQYLDVTVNDTDTRETPTRRSYNETKHGTFLLKFIQELVTSCCRHHVPVQIHKIYAHARELEEHANETFTAPITMSYLLLASAQVSLPRHDITFIPILESPGKLTI